VSGRCGTADGYNDHMRNGSRVCRECRDAQAVYMTRLRRRKMLGLPLQGDRLAGPRWIESCGDMAQAGARFLAGVVEGA
jgi:hypothetical protein